MSQILEVFLQKAQKRGWEIRPFSRLNQDVFEELRFYTSDEALLVAALLANPDGRTSHISRWKNLLEGRVYDYLSLLNCCYSYDHKWFIVDDPDCQKTALMFLINQKVLLRSGEGVFNKKKVRFSWFLLQQNPNT